MFSSFKSAPALVGMGVASVLGWALSLLVLHGVITNTVASQATQEFAPPLVAVVLGGLGVLIHKAMPVLERETGLVVQRFAPGEAPAVERVEATAVAAVDRWLAPSAVVVPPLDALSPPIAANVGVGVGTDSQPLTVSVVSDTSQVTAPAAVVPLRAG